MSTTPRGPYTVSFCSWIKRLIFFSIYQRQDFNPHIYIYSSQRTRGNRHICCTVLEYSSLLPSRSMYLCTGRTDRQWDKQSSFRNTSVHLAFRPHHTSDLVLSSFWQKQLGRSVVWDYKKHWIWLSWWNDFYRLRVDMWRVPDYNFLFSNNERYTTFPLSSCGYVVWNFTAVPSV